MTEKELEAAASGFLDTAFSKHSDPRVSCGLSVVLAG